MRSTYTYESILSAVGRVLDEAGVKRIAIQDTGDGLIVEGFDGEGRPQVVERYDIPALYSLVEVASDAQHLLTTNDEGTLRQFLHDHELVGAR